MRTLDKYPQESLCGSDYYYSYYLVSKVNACLFFLKAGCMLIKCSAFIANSLVCFLVEILKPLLLFIFFFFTRQADFINFRFNLKNECGTYWLSTLKNSMFNNCEGFPSDLSVF